MSADATTELGTAPRNWVIGAISGLIAGIAFGAIMSHTEMMGMVGMLFDLEEVWLGWVIHFVFSIVFGIGFAAIVAIDAVSAWSDRPSRGAVSGLVYGIIVWVIGAAIIMPLWMGAVQPVDPPVPDWNMMSFAGHIGFGVVLGVLYPVLLDHEPN